MKGKILTTGLMGICVVALCFILVWVASPEIYEAHGEFASWWDSVRTDANGKVSQLCAGGNGTYLKEVKRLVDECRSLSFSSNVLMRFLSEDPPWHNSISSLHESVRGITVLVSELPIPVLTVWAKANSPELADLEFTHFLSAKVWRTPANKGLGTFREVVFPRFRLKRAIRRRGRRCPRSRGGAVRLPARASPRLPPPSRAPTFRSA